MSQHFRAAMSGRRTTETAVTIDRVIVQNICAIVSTLHEKREFVNAASQAHLEARPSRLPSYLVLGKR